MDAGHRFAEAAVPNKILLEVADLPVEQIVGHFQADNEQLLPSHKSPP